MNRVGICPSIFSTSKRTLRNRIVLFGLAGLSFCVTASGELSRVSVKDNRFVTADGKVIVLRGLDASDPDKLERNGQWNRHYFEEARAWGANVVRIPIHPAAWRLHGKE